MPLVNTGLLNRIKEKLQLKNLCKSTAVTSVKQAVEFSFSKVCLVLLWLELCIFN